MIQTRTILAALVLSTLACSGGEEAGIHDQTTPLDGTWSLAVQQLCPVGTMTLENGVVNEPAQAASATGTWSCGTSSGTAEAGMNLVDGNATILFKSGGQTVWGAEVDVSTAAMTGLAYPAAGTGEHLFTATKR
jgi:hypothetical protein